MRGTLVFPQRDGQDVRNPTRVRGREGAMAVRETTPFDTTMVCGTKVITSKPDTTKYNRDYAARAGNARRAAGSADAMARRQTEIAISIDTIFKTLRPGTSPATASSMKLTSSESLSCWDSPSVSLIVPRNSPEANSSGLRWRGHWSISPPSYWRTNLRATWIPRTLKSCFACYASQTRNSARPS